MTGVGTGAGPKIASDSATQDFGWISWNERSVYTVAEVTWEMAPGAVGGRFITSRGNLPQTGATGKRS